MKLMKGPSIPNYVIKFIAVLEIVLFNPAIVAAGNPLPESSKGPKVYSREQQLQL